MVLFVQLSFNGSDAAIFDLYPHFFVVVVAFVYVVDCFSLVAAAVDEDADEVVASGTFELLLPLLVVVFCFCCLPGPDGRFSVNRSLPWTRTTLLPVEPLRGRPPAARAGPSPKEPVLRRPLPDGRFVTSTVRLPAESHLLKGVVCLRILLKFFITSHA